MIIDCHAHFYSRAFINEFKSLQSYGFELKQTKPGVFPLTREGNPPGPVFSPAFYDIDSRLEIMEKGGVAMEVLSAVQPGITWAKPDLGLHLAQLINEGIYEVCQKHPKRFLGLASVPLQDVKLAVAEMERAMRQLRFKGVEIPTTVNGKDLDAPEFLPFFQKAQELGAIVFVHPFHWQPLTGRVSSYQLDGGAFGLMLEDEISILKIIFSGLLEKLPDLKIALPHLGGGVSFLIGRVDRQAIITPRMCANISKPPSYYLGKMYFDTAYYYTPALMCVLANVPEDHVIFGTDYAFGVGYAPDEGVKMIKEDPAVPDRLKTKILEDNPAALLGL